MRAHEDIVPNARGILVVADDLAGAAETAAALAANSSLRVELLLGQGARPEDPESLLVVDTDSRYQPDGEAGRRLGLALAARPGATLILKKIDSLLRGRIAEETAVLVSTGHPVVAAFALPSMGRTVADGVVLVDGVPLHLTSAWAAERTRPPESIPQLLANVPTSVVPLPVVRSEDLAGVLAESVRSGVLPVCDASEQSDLERIADAALGLGADGRSVILMGTGGLARALGQVVETVGAATVPVRPEVTRPLLVVVGTVADPVAAQVERLLQQGVPGIEVTPSDLSADGTGALVARVMHALQSGVAVVYVDRDTRWHRDDLSIIARGLSERIDLREFDLVLTGGETARRILDSAGITTIYPERELADGVVLSRTTLGARVVTRPGSFGDENSLLDIVSRLARGAGVSPEKKEVNG